MSVPYSSLWPLLFQGLNNAVALDFHYSEQMIYWTDVTTQGSMIRRMGMNGSNMEVGKHHLFTNRKFVPTSFLNVTL